MSFVGKVSTCAVGMRRCQGGAGADSFGAACRSSASVEVVAPLAVRDGGVGPALRLRAVYALREERGHARRPAGERGCDVLARADLALRGGPARATRASVSCDGGGEDPREQVEEFLAAEAAKRAER